MNLKMPVFNIQNGKHSSVWQITVTEQIFLCIFLDTFHTTWMSFIKINRAIKLYMLCTQYSFNMSCGMLKEQ
jgi:hypothetical protein